MLWLIGSGQSASAQSANACADGTIESRIAGCTALLRGARTAHQKAIALDGLCWAKKDQQAFQDALADCDRAILLDDRYSYSYHHRAQVYLGLDNESAALNDLNTALRLRPTFIYSLLERAKIFARRGNVAQAIADYDEVLRLKPDNAEASTGRAALTKTRDRPSSPQPPVRQPPASSSNLPAFSPLCGDAPCD